MRGTHVTKGIHDNVNRLKIKHFSLTYLKADKKRLHMNQFPCKIFSLCWERLYIASNGD